MGAIPEINSIVRFPEDFDFSKPKHGLKAKLVEAGKYTGEAK